MGSYVQRAWDSNIQWAFTLYSWSWNAVWNVYSASSITFRELNIRVSSYKHVDQWDLVCFSVPSKATTFFLHNVSMKNRETGITSPRTLQTTVQSCWQRLKWWNFCKMAPNASKLRLLVFTLAIYWLLHFKYTLVDKQANLERLFLITNTFSPHCLWLVVPILIVLTRSITNVASGVLLVLGGMSRSWGGVCCDCDGMFLMNTKLEKNINTQKHKNNRKKHYLKEPASHKKTAAFSFRVVVS